MINSRVMNNPWIDIASYEIKDAYRFKGREEDVHKFLRILYEGTMSVLYANSGIGKTSFINAGIIPVLKRENYIPIKIRFSQDFFESADVDKWLYNEIVNIGSDECRDEFEWIPKADNLCLVDQTITNSLWWLLHTCQIHNKKTKEFFYPVIIFDQFEEVFTKPSNIHGGSYKIQNRLFEILSEISSNALPINVESYLDNYNEYIEIDSKHYFKVIFSLRKEYLSDFDYWTNEKNSITELYQNRMFLLPMTHKQAEEVITKQPINSSNPTLFVDTLISIKQDILNHIDPNKSGNVEPLMLSVLCSRLFALAQTQGSKELNASDLNQIDLNSIIRSFYEDNIKILGEEQLVALFEDKIIDDNGHRNRIKSSSIFKYPNEEYSSLKIPYLVQEKLESIHLIRTERYNGDVYVELIHDRIAEVITARKKEREAKINVQKRRRNNVKKYRAKQNLLTLLGRSLFNNSGFDFSEDNSRSILSNSSKEHLKRHSISNIHSREYDGSDNVFIADILNQVVGGNNLSIQFGGKITKDGYYALGINTTVVKSQKIIDGIVFYGSEINKEAICSEEGFCGIDVEYDSVEGVEKARIYKHSVDGINVSGVSRYEITEYDNGLPVKILFKNEQNEICKHFDGNYGVEFHYDKYGNEIYRRYLDKDGISSCKIYNHIYGLKSEYNDQDMRTLQYFVDEDGVITEDAYEIVGVKYDYDEAGNNTRIVYIGKDKMPCMNPYGYSIINIEYENAKPYRYSFCDVNGTPVNKNDGGLFYHVLEVTGYDDCDRISGYILKDVDGTQILKLLLFYDQVGHITDIKYYIGDRITINPISRAHHVHYDYYLNGLMSSTSTYDINGSPVEDISGFYKANFEYDENGKLLKRLFFKQNTENPNMYQAYEYLADDKCIMHEVTYKMTSDGKPLDIIHQEVVQGWTINHKFQATEIIYGENNSYTQTPIRVKYKFNLEGDVIEYRLFVIETSLPVADDNGDYGYRQYTNKDSGEIISINLDKEGNCSRNNHSYAIMVRKNDLHQGQECVVTTYFDEANQPVLSELGYHKIIESSLVGDDELNFNAFLFDTDGKPCNCIYGYSQQCFEQEIIGEERVKRTISFVGEDGAPKINTFLGFHKREQIFDSQSEISRCYYDEKGNLINVSDGFAKQTFKTCNSFSTLLRYPFDDHCVVRFYDQQNRKVEVDFMAGGKTYHGYKFILSSDNSSIFKVINAQGKTLYNDTTIMWKYIYILAVPLMLIIMCPVFLLSQFYKKLFKKKSKQAIINNPCPIIKVAQVYNEVPEGNSPVIAPAKSIGLKEGYWIVEWNDWTYKNDYDTIDEFQLEFNKKENKKFITFYNPDEKDSSKCFIKVGLLNNNIGIRIVDGEVDESDVAKMLELKNNTL